MADGQKYEAVIGLEIHAQLATESKLFCGDATSFGAEPNSHISPITLGHPGTLPKTNKKAVEYAIKMGIACESVIEKITTSQEKITSTLIYPKDIKFHNTLHLFVLEEKWLFR